MSSGALFGNNASRGASKNLVEFKAGKMTVKGKMVYPDTRKGQLYVYQSDDSLMHFCWKDRTTGVVEDDLIIFPDDCEFKHVPQCKTGRVYLLRFKSSNKKFFFWLQDLKTDKDEEHCRKINDVLNNPPTPGSQRSGGTNAEGDLQNLLNNMSQQQLIQLFGGVGQIGGLGSLLGTMNRPHGVQSTRASTTTSSTPATTNVTRPPHSLTPGPNTDSKSSSNNKSSTRTTAPSTPAATAAAPSNRIQLSDLQNFLSEIPTPSRTEPAVQKNAAEATAMICAAYGENAVSHATCKRWYQKFHQGDFSLKDKSLAGRPEKIETDELQALLDINSAQTEKELAEQLGVTQQAISVRLHTNKD
ncbi:PREDICTED: proteasomal ubiquitin receptor ADRM1 homolog isoform X2 [Cyphomyrmex costatus]|uniref:proteasomal ubiquitin receptor ADRM1 homolog isoform X2 n=1 Tax=Cyphomyrmex costatus TaxID=456900 RepID=UPI0008523363|nr:PREDICTED: proteasomal ubiquitin receptor ADRM1 homolog isoform X2 [Cyphomyrmex costatus]